MWPFDRSERALETLLKYTGGVDPGYLASNGSVLSTAPTTVQYILILVDSEDLETVSELIAQAVRIVQNHGGVVLGMEASLILVTLNLPRESAGHLSDSARSALVSALSTHLGGSASIVHGAAEGRSGTVGSDSAMSWTVLLPNFRETLRVLASLSAGDVQELRQDIVMQPTV